LPLAEPFRRRLAELGYVEGENLAFEYRWGEGRVERLPELAAELVHANVDLIVAATQPAALAVKRLPGTIPIVMNVAIDPVESGLVASLARPGGNVTGLTWEVGPELSQKLVEIIKEAVPSISRLAALWDPTFPGQAARLNEMKAAAQALGIILRPIEFERPEAITGAFSILTKERPDALLVPTHPLYYRHQREIIDFTAEHRLPAIYFTREFVDAGGLISYGPSQKWLYRREAVYVDKIFRGAKPGELPMEQPSVFELVINLKTAKVLSLAIPTSLLVHADEVIE
jgi:putative tryptophan/tyrosine transport system substrate-binding protein